MTEGDPADRLSAKRQFVMVLRLIVEGDGRVKGELVDPVSLRRQRFNGFARLSDTLRDWIDGALSSTAREFGGHPTSKPTDT